MYFYSSTHCYWLLFSRSLDVFETNSTHVNDTWSKFEQANRHQNKTSLDFIWHVSWTSLVLPVTLLMMGQHQDCSCQFLYGYRTEVAIEASNIILMGDNFSLIINVIMWGCHINDTVCKFLQFWISTNILAIIITFVTGSSFVSGRCAERCSVALDYHGYLWRACAWDGPGFPSPAQLQARQEDGSATAHPQSLENPPPAPVIPYSHFCIWRVSPPYFKDR